MEQAYDDGWNAARWDAAHPNAPRTANRFASWGEWATRYRGTWAQGYQDFVNQEYTVT